MLGGRWQGVGEGAQGGEVAGARAAAANANVCLSSRGLRGPPGGPKRRHCSALMVRLAVEQVFPGLAACVGRIYKKIVDGVFPGKKGERAREKREGEQLRVAGSPVGTPKWIRTLSSPSRPRTGRASSRLAQTLFCSFGQAPQLRV